MRASAISSIKTSCVSPQAYKPRRARSHLIWGVVTINTYEDNGFAGGRRILIVEFSEHFIDTTTDVEEVIALEELVCAHLRNAMLSTTYPSFPVSSIEDLEILYAFHNFVVEKVFVYAHGSGQFALPFPCQMEVSAEIEQFLFDDFVNESSIGALGAAQQGLVRAQTNFCFLLHDARYRRLWSLDGDSQTRLMLVQEYILAMVKCARFLDKSFAVTFKE